MSERKGKQPVCRLIVSSLHESSQIIAAETISKQPLRGAEPGGMGLNGCTAPGADTGGMGLKRLNCDNSFWREICHLKTFILRFLIKSSYSKITVK